MSKKIKRDKHIISLAPTWSNLHVLTQDSNGDLHFLTLLKQTDVGKCRHSYVYFLTMDINIKSPNKVLVETLRF